MRFKDIFIELLAFAKQLPNIQDIVIDFDSTVTVANYTPDQSGGIIRIHRYDKNKPNSSYASDIISLLHELGHQVNIVEFKNYPILSKTGYVYDPNTKETQFGVLKEEWSAWINAYKILWSTKLPSLTVAYKILLSFIISYQAIESLSSYVDYYNFNN